MKNGSTVLLENKGVWYLHGEALRIGRPVVIDGVVWSVLAVGRSQNESRTPFLWIRNRQYGTTIYAPSIVEHKPRVKVYPPEEASALCLTAARVA